MTRVRTSVPPLCVCVYDDFVISSIYPKKEKEEETLKDHRHIYVSVGIWSKLHWIEMETEKKECKDEFETKMNLRQLIIYRY